MKIPSPFYGRYIFFPPSASVKSLTSLSGFNNLFLKTYPMYSELGASLISLDENSGELADGRQSGSEACCWHAPASLGGQSLDSLSHQLLWQVLECIFLAFSFLTCRLVMKARSALNQGSSMALVSFLAFRASYILLPPLFYEVRKKCSIDL